MRRASWIKAEDATIAVSKAIKGRLHIGGRAQASYLRFAKQRARFFSAYVNLAVFADFSKKSAKFLVASAPFSVA
jgi:hypothetical protein